MLALGAHAMERALAANRTISVKDRLDELDLIAHHWTLAEELSDTCRNYYREKKSYLSLNHNFGE